MKSFFKLFSKMTVRAQLRVAFVSIVVGSALIGAFSLVEMRSIKNASQQMFDREFKSSIAAEKARTLITTVLSNQRQLLMATTPGERDGLSRQLSKDIKEMQSMIARLDDSATAAQREEQDRLSALSKSWAAETAQFAELVSKQPLDPNAFDSSVRSSFLDLEIKADKMLKLAAAAEKSRSDAAAAQLSVNENAYTLAVKSVALALVALLVFAAIIGHAVTAQLLKQLGGEPALAKDIASRVAGGDLTVHIPIKDGDSSSILYALNEMKTSLVYMISQIAEGAEAVSCASREIASANNDLSNRTSEQASSLESAICNLDSTAQAVKHNAASAASAEKSSVQAEQIARAAAEIAQQAVDKMDGIVAASRGISDITAVIESIAFQTNLLALNAAVESAHAGSNGNGFSVIAKEVRALSQKVVESSDKINKLIKSSHETIEDGRLLVEKSGASMQEIAAAISSIKKQISQISQMSAGQTAEVDNVKKMLDTIGGNTLQTAAKVEQTAAASSMLDSQTSTLNTIISNFRVR